MASQAFWATNARFYKQERSFKTKVLLYQHLKRPKGQYISTSLIGSLQRFTESVIFNAGKELQEGATVRLDNAYHDMNQ